MTHPGYCDEALKNASLYKSQREIELDILTDYSVIDRIVSSGLELVNFGDLSTV